jgi:glycogen synthase
MRVSVVINTYNRGPSLRRTLQSLRYQTFADFEVVVVNGPSTDETPAVLVEFAGAVRVGRCPEPHLSKSRNVGIGLASGEVVAFLDDDAVPEPPWLEQLVAAYQDERVGGAGGIVYDHTGLRLQYERGACTRLGAAVPVAETLEGYTRPGADPFLGLLGTNCSFRRKCLVEIGGFDEEIEYFLDETEVCLQVIDRGFTIRALPGAAVHHKYLASHLRSPQKVVLNPYPFAKNRSYFALRHGRRTRSLREVTRALDAFAEDLRNHCATHFRAGRIDAGQREFFLAQLERGLRDGRERGLHGERRSREIPPPDPRRFLPFPVLRPAGGRRTICFLAQECPNRDVGVGLASQGHEVHVVTRSPDTNRVDFEGGAWLHWLAEPERYLPELEGAPLAGALARAAACYHEARRIHAGGPLDVVVAPRSGSEGLVCALDKERFPTVLADARELALPTPAGHAERTGGPTPARGGLDPVAARLAGLLVEWVGLPPEAAGRTAARLLDPSCYPVDHRAVVRRLLRAPDEEFLSGLYHLLLNRDPDDEGLANHLRRLRAGIPRAVVVRDVALSDEARRAGLPVAWLTALGRPAWHRHVPQRAWGLVKRVARALLGRRGRRAA